MDVRRSGDDAGRGRPLALGRGAAVDGGGEPREKRERDDGRDEIENGHSDDDSGGGGSVVLSCINYSLAKLEFDGNFPSLAFDFYTESCSALGAATSLAPSPT